MNSAKEFSQSIIEQLGFYVYLLIDPETEQIFYVGKGTGNRIFAHINQALISLKDTDKLEKIRELQAKGINVKHIIHRHGLSEKEAFEVESSLIDFIGLDELVNVVSGYESNSRGQMNISEIVALYDAPKIEIIEPSILITVNRLYKRGMSEEDLYEITRGSWVIGKRRDKAKYAFSIYNGIVRQVYSIYSWSPILVKNPQVKTRQRWRFEGVAAKEMQHFVGGSVVDYITQGAQNPIKYVNCSLGDT
jgi:uncharacterized protein